MIFSTGDCYTMREISPGLYEYVRGECAELPVGCVPEGE